MNKFSSMTDEALLSSFKESAQRYGGALSIGDHKEANRASQCGLKIKREIKARGITVISMLLDLLDHEDPWIRYAAAASTLDTEPERARGVLTELQAHQKAIGAAAYTVLRMWDTGPRWS